MITEDRIPLLNIFVEGFGGGGEIDLHIGIAVVISLMACRLQQIGRLSGGALAVADHLEQTFDFCFSVNLPTVKAAVYGNGFAVGSFQRFGGIVGIIFFGEVLYVCSDRLLVNLERSFSIQRNPFGEHVRSFYPYRIICLWPQRAFRCHSAYPGRKSFFEKAEKVMPGNSGSSEYSPKKSEKDSADLTDRSKVSYTEKWRQKQCASAACFLHFYVEDETFRASLPLF